MMTRVGIYRVAASVASREYQLTAVSKLSLGLSFFSSLFLDYRGKGLQVFWLCVETPVAKSACE